MDIMNAIKSFIKKYWITAIIVVSACLTYKDLTDHKKIDTFVFTPFDEILKSFGRFWPVMLKNLVSSFQLLFPSLFLGVAIALIGGVIMGLNKRIRETLHPLIYGASVIPAILLSPIALHVAPDFRTASVFLIVYNTIWPTLFATITGIMTIDKRYLDTASSMEIKGFDKMIHVIFPAAMPSIISGFITSLRGSFMILVFAEMYGTEFGMGYFIKKYSTFGLYSEVWSGFIFLVIVLVSVVQVFEHIKNRLLKWTLN